MLLCCNKLVEIYVSKLSTTVCLFQRKRQSHDAHIEDSYGLDRTCYRYWLPDNLALSLDVLADEQLQKIWSHIVKIPCKRCSTALLDILLVNYFKGYYTFPIVWFVSIKILL